MINKSIINKKKKPMKDFKNKTILSAMAAVLVAGTAFFTSCEKDDAKVCSPNNYSMKNHFSIPHFSSIEELENTVNTATSFDTISKLIEFEKQQGRNSIGAISDLFYDNIQIESFADENEVMNFFATHEDVLDTIMGKDGLSILPKLSNTPYRYVANENGMFSVGDMCYKLFKTGTVCASDKFVDELALLTDEDLDMLDTNIFIYIPDEVKTIDAKGCITKWKQVNNPTSSKDRIYIELITNTQYRGSIGYVAVTRVKVYNLHKFLGIWWTSKHSLSCKGTIKLHIKTMNCSEWESIDKTIERHQKANVMWVPVYEQPCYWTCVDGWDILFNRFYKYYHYDGFSIDAWYPGHAVEHFAK